jgi:hypothetical protein
MNRNTDSSPRLQASLLLPALPLLVVAGCQTSSSTTPDFDEARCDPEIEALANSGKNPGGRGEELENAVNTLMKEAESKAVG